MRRAVIVAGHAIPRDFVDPLADSSWFLLHFQRGEARCYVDHVRRGVEIAAADGEAVLIFTGGQTRAEAGQRSEAAGYRGVAEHFGWWGYPEVAARTLTEEFARDSFENLLFGLARFHQAAGNWPEQVALVSWAFKAERFALHRQAIRWPAGRFQYIGAGDPPEREQAVAAEARNRAAYVLDPYSASPEFRAKKAARNPFGQVHGYHQHVPALRQLLAHEGPEWFTGPLPWE